MAPMALVLFLAALFSVEGAPNTLKEAQLPSDTDRIVGGQNATEGQFPYQVVVFPPGEICGGSIISKTFILTAAHCLMKQGTYTIRAGSVDTDAAEVFEVKRTIKHPEFEYDAKKYYPNDVGLLELSRPLQFNSKVQTITLATSAPQIGTAALTSGWGMTRPEDTTSYPKILQFLETKIAAKHQAVPESPGRIFILDRKGTGTCNGDSGSATVIDGPSGKVQVGITSFSINGCASGNPDGLASVAHYYNWIQQNSQ